MGYAKISLSFSGHALECSIQAVWGRTLEGYLAPWSASQLAQQIDSTGPFHRWVAEAQRGPALAELGYRYYHVTSAKV
jgi:hypothetical protein